jgi:hypothetical protein
LSNDNLRAFDFILGLRPVAAISEEKATALGDKQRRRASGKSAKILDVRKMSNQQAIKFVAGERIPQPLKPRSMIHSARLV